jgi:hypothetical protein
MEKEVGGCCWLKNLLLPKVNSRVIMMIGITIPEGLPPQERPPEGIGKMLKTAAKVLSRVLVASLAFIGLKTAADSLSDSARLYRSMGQSGVGAIEFLAESVPCRLSIEPGQMKFPEVRGSIVLEMFFNGKKIRIVDRNADGTGFFGNPDEMSKDGGEGFPVWMIEEKQGVLKEVYRQGVKEAQRRLDKEAEGKLNFLDLKKQNEPKMEIAMRSMQKENSPEALLHTRRITHPAIRANRPRQKLV